MAAMAASGAAAPSSVRVTSTGTLLPTATLPSRPRTAGAAASAGGDGNGVGNDASEMARDGDAAAVLQRLLEARSKMRARDSFRGE